MMFKKLNLEGNICLQAPAREYNKLKTVLEQLFLLFIYLFLLTSPLKIHL